MVKMALEGWKWVVQSIAVRIFWDWEFIPLGPFAPYVFGITIWSWPHRTKDDTKETTQDATHQD